MKTNSENQPTPSGNPQAGADNNPRKYQAILSFKQLDRAAVIIEAHTLQEAKEKAEDIHSDEVMDWNLIHAEVSVDSVELIGEGKSRE